MRITSHWSCSIRLPHNRRLSISAVVMTLTQRMKTLARDSRPRTYLLCQLRTKRHASKNFRPYALRDYLLTLIRLRMIRTFLTTIKTSISISAILSSIDTVRRRFCLSCFSTATESSHCWTWTSRLPVRLLKSLVSWTTAANTLQTQYTT
jgi:hypothetical protein